SLIILPSPPRPTLFPYTTLFRSLQAVTIDPTLWRCAIDVAGVVEWDGRGGGLSMTNYTNPRLGTAIENPAGYEAAAPWKHMEKLDRKSTRLNSSHRTISYAVFCL